MALVRERVGRFTARVWSHARAGRAALRRAARGDRVQGLPRLHPVAYQLAAVGYGVPYDWGGESLWGSDCSGWPFWVSHTIPGIVVPLPRLGRHQATQGARIPVSDAVLGDLVIYTHPDGRVRHVMMSVGNGWVLGARGGGSGTTADRPGAYVDLRPATYWRSALSHAVATAAYRR